MMRFLHLLLNLCIVAHGTSVDIDARDNCHDHFSSCSPQGASSASIPAVGAALSSLYIDLLKSINDVKKGKRGNRATVHHLNARSSPSGLCCADGTDCLLLEELSLPFCYDKFTTNFFLPGGAYGTVVSGNYTSPVGDVANLLTGDFTLADGTQGNIYGSPSSPSKPNTSTLTIPTQFTGSGTGSVIPLTALGQEITYTTTIPGTTVPPSTIAVLTIDPSTVAGGTVVPATTRFSTIAGTTIPPRTSTVTTMVAHSSSTPSSAVAIVRPRFNFVETVCVYVALFMGLHLLQLRNLC